MGMPKGRTGNPNGRPRKGECLTDILRAELDKKDVEDDDGNFITGREAIAIRLKRLALAGDMAALRYIYDRIDGTPKSEIDVNTSDDGFTIIFAQNLEGI